MIDFKTYDEQIEILEKRGLIITDKNAAKKILKIHNYYNLINAYKDVFIDKGTTPETFIKGVTFDELFINIHSIPTNSILIKMGIPQQFINQKE